MDLSKHRLHNISEIERFRDEMGSEAFEKYKAAVYATLRKLKNRQIFSIIKNVQSKNYALFIKLSELYMIEKKRDCNIIFLPGFCEIRGEKTFNEEEEDMRLYQEQVKRMTSHKK
jgi:hypothetical protein